MSSPGHGRRQHITAETRARIFDAARELFRTLPYSDVSTDEVARRAAVDDAAVRGYVSTKTELLLMVYNAAFRERVARGLDAIAETDDTQRDATARIMTLVSPVVVDSLADENVATYQREVLFGPPDRHRAEALEIVAGLRGVIAGILAQAWRTRHGSSSPPAPEIAARTVSTSVHMAVVQAARTAGEDVDTGSDGVLAELHEQIGLVVAGYLTR